MGFDRHKSSVEFRIERGAWVVANESSEGGVRSSGATAVEAIA